VRTPAPLRNGDIMTACKDESNLRERHFPRTSVMRKRRTAEVPEDPNISSRSRKVLSAHVQKVVCAYIPVYIGMCWDNVLCEEGLSGRYALDANKVQGRFGTTPDLLKKTPNKFTREIPTRRSVAVLGDSRIKETLMGTDEAIVVRTYGPDLDVLRAKADEIGRGR
jgi:hypothetical protein